jgi:hypothetical protein
MSGNAVALPGRLSYSSLSSYAECGERWRLERGYHLDDSTWWATVAGSAIHEVTEFYDLDMLGVDVADKFPHLMLVEAMVDQDRSVEAEQVILIERYSDLWIEVAFEVTLDKKVASEAERGTTEIKASGKQLKSVGKTGGPNKKDRDWWLDEGPKILQGYIDWRKLTKWKIPVMPDGQYGVEVRVPVDFAGRPQLGFIDRVFELPDGRLVIVDIKTGKEPVSKLQLGTYAVALLKLFGVQVDFGTYWMGGTRDIVAPFKDVTEYTEDYIDHQFEMAWRGIEAGVFLPNVTSMCSGCGVREFCRAVGGKKSVTIPIESVLVRRDGTRPEHRTINVAQVTAA